MLKTGNHSHAGGGILITAEISAYNRIMGRMFACLVFAICLWGQGGPKSSKELEDTLLALQNANVDRAPLTNQLVEVMTLTARQDQRPSRSTIESFADEFTRAMHGRKITKLQSATLQSSIRNILNGPTANADSAGRFRQVLTAVGIDSSARVELTGKFISIGQEVRGPDDTPAVVK